MKSYDVENGIIRPTVKLKRDIYKEMKLIMTMQDTNFQEVAEQLILKWIEENKQEVM